MAFKVMGSMTGPSPTGGVKKDNRTVLTDGMESSRFSGKMTGGAGLTNVTMPQPRFGGMKPVVK